MKNDLFEMNRVGIRMTNLCNLRCRLCVAHSPYTKDTVHISIETLNKSVDRYFEIVDYVGKLSIAGGEPLLHPDLPDFLRHLSIYKEKIGTVELVTNGTIVPDIKLIETMRLFEPKFNLLIDNYGSVSSKVNQIDKVMSNHNVTYSIRDYCSESMHCGGWVDLGNATERKHSYEEAVKLYAKCLFPQKMKFCFGITKGKIFPCGTVSRRYQLNLQTDYNEYIDLFDESLTVEQQRKKITDIYNGNYLSACEYCNGMCEDSVRYKPAEQLSIEEYRKIRAGL
ncbi:MAG: radical SAM protein [Ruminiclostridium sp.]